MANRPPFVSVALLSAATLAYEILVIHLFSIIQWHHFASMIISLALLGYGMSGTCLTIGRHWLHRHFQPLYLFCIIMFSATSLGAFYLGQSVPFSAEELLWDAGQILVLASLFLLFSVPFFFSASAIGLSFLRYKESIATLYGADLLGAGLGGLLCLGLLFLLLPLQVLIAVSGGGLAAAVAAVWELHHPRRTVIAAALAGLAGILWYPAASQELRLSPYKSQEQYLRIAGTRILETRSSPLGLLTVMTSDLIPFRHAPGLSLNAVQEPLPQLGIFTNGDNLSVITRKAEQRRQLAYLDQLSSALPYHLAQPASVLVLGSGGGADILQARYHRVGQIEAVELNPQIVDLLTTTYAGYAGLLENDGPTHIRVADIRGFMEWNQDPFDLIQLSLIDGFTPSISGLYALSENYLYTVEALEAYLEDLADNGYLAVTRWLKNPPRDTLKLFTTAVSALKRSGFPDPENRLVLIRSWQTSTLLVKKGRFSGDEIAAALRFCRERSFDIAFAPGLSENQVNRHNVLDQPHFYLATKALAGDGAADFIARYKFNIEPATDDRPYFHHFFKWSSLPEIRRLRGQGGVSLLEFGYLLLIATLAVAVVASVILILLPLTLLGSAGSAGQNPGAPLRTALYFFSTGLAFMLLEIAFIQRFTLFLHHPVYAIATTLAAFLVWAGLGSHLSRRLARRTGSRTALTCAVAGIALLGLLALVFLEQIFLAAAALPLALKVPLSAGLIAPLAVLMGMPFPLGLACLAETGDRQIPWAWGINGCASVIGAALAAVLAIHGGFSLVILAALVLYLSLPPVWPRAKTS